MTIDWIAIGDFIKTVGIPTGLLLLVIVPLVYAVYNVIKEWGPKVAQSHVAFLTTATETQVKNADTLSRLESTIRTSVQDHYNFTKAIRLGAQAGEAMLKDQKEVAKIKLAQINDLLNDNEKES